MSRPSYKSQIPVQQYGHSRLTKHYTALLIICLALLAGCAADKCTSGDCQLKETADQTTMNSDTFETQQKVAFKPGSETPTEKINSLSFDGERVTLNVVSHGCTVENQFSIDHVMQENQCYATVVRSEPDLCKRMPFMVQVTIPWTRPAGCENLNIIFTNPLLENVSKTRSGGKQLPEKSKGN